MLLSPLENTASFAGAWVQVKPRITQKFGLNKQIYSRFGLVGHNGVDFGCPVGTPIFAPIEGIIKTGNDGSGGYGLYIKIRRAWHTPVEVVLAHLSNIVVSSGQTVNLGQLIGYSGNTGFSTGAHLHFGLRFLSKDSGEDLFNWSVKDKNNGYAGYINQLDSIITFKGKLEKSNLI